jgi:hypothetical protein
LLLPTCKRRKKEKGFEWGLKFVGGIFQPQFGDFKQEWKTFKRERKTPSEAA